MKSRYRSPRPPFLRAALLLHVLAVPALLLRPQLWPAVVTMVVATQVAIVVATLLPRSTLLGANLTRLPSGGSGDRTVALTFDDGPDPEVTPRVLELLAEHQAVATFFVIGRKASEHPEIVKEVVRRGHRVENHTYSHSYRFGFFGPRRLGQEVDEAQQVILELTGRQPEFVRAPAGIRNLWLDGVLAKRSLHLASWTRRGYDTVDGNVEHVCGRLLRRLRPGDILVFHDGAATLDPTGQPVVLPALARTLEALSDRGLTCGLLRPRA